MSKVTRDNIGIFSFGRKQSQRCPNKMLRPFADTTLTDIILTKLESFGSSAFFAGYEGEFEEKCRDKGVRFVMRDQHSVLIDGPITEILSFLKNQPFEYFLIINGCLPFLKSETMHRFLNKCVDENLTSAFAVIKRHNFYFNMDRKPLNFSMDLKTINTKAVESVHEFAHALYFFNKDYFFMHGRYWDWNRVELIEISGKLELVDIDTEEDFAIAQSMWPIYRKSMFLEKV